MRVTLLILFMLLTAMLGGCTSYHPSSRLPVPDMRGQDVKVVTVPLPVIATSPNEGITYGALTAFLLHNEKDEVCTLIAPQLNSNDNFGTTASIYGAFYPSPQRSFEGNISKSTEVNQDYELRVRDQSLLEQQLELNGFFYLFTDGSARFFGLRSNSSADNETNFGDQEFGFALSAGYPILDHTQLFVGERFRGVRIARGAVQKVPFIREVFDAEQIPGSVRFNTHAQTLSLVYSTLDSVTMPSSGLRARATVETSLDALGSSTNFRHYEAELKGFYPVKDGRFISVGRVAYSQTLGDKVPFLERSTLGGEPSSIFRASILPTSRMSLMSVSRCSPLVRMISSRCCCLSVSVF